MPNYRYKAKSEYGEVTGIVKANLASEVTKMLKDAGYTNITVEERKGVSLDKLTNIFQRVRPEDLIFFTRQMRALYKSGVPILSGLKAIGEQTSNPKLKAIITDISSSIDQGNKLSDALAQNSKIFSKVYTNMVYTGEMSGNLHQVLEKLISILEFNKKTTDNLKAAVRYPITVVITLCAAFIFLVIYVLPKFVDIFKTSNVALPLPTRIMIGINHIAHNYWFFLLGGIALLSVGFYLFTRQEYGRLFWDQSKLRFPIIGDFFLKIYMSRFSATLEALTKSGVPIVNALDVVSGTIGNEFISSKINEVGEKIKVGTGLTDAIKESGVFPPLVIQMILTGEKAGSLDDMLIEVTDYYEREIEYSINKLSSYIEPILTITLGIMVVFFALAVFLPWWDLIKVVKGGM